MSIKRLLIVMCFFALPVFATAQTHAHAKVWTDATRLAALLSDAQQNVSVDANVWRVVANEANTLANRIYAGSSGKARTAARDLRTHVREFRKAALAGDASTARSHASEAQPFVYQIIDWSM